MDIGIIGAGPAGLALAWFLKGTKYNVTVYEGLNDVGLKPCAWGLISGIEDYVPITKEAIISEIKGFRIYLDDKLVHDIRVNKKLGYIINKPIFLSNIAEKVEVKYNTKIIEKDSEYFTTEGTKIIADKMIYANGHYSLPKDNTIPAIQYVTDYQIDKEIVEFYFYNDLLGYAWIFPDENGSKIGIGGWADISFLKERIKKILKGKILNFHGARVSDFGILEERLNGRFIGEALGTVYPLTGEGIRPSIISAKILADSLLNEKNFEREFKKSKLYWTIQTQAKVVHGVKKGYMSLKGLSRIMTKSDPNLVLKVAIGDFDSFDIIKLFGRMII
ncbi:NAD(P)/FAD-dependent oxidoreductase [Sulfolobus sp. S-194]|uniref:NAD(P)/FAD-dependent oxidoreductase n=1 Tax=Sulfolobus sp. S-194 TaxID=2512240 RepID=UPI001436F29B|nr:NAD(P)/FAD-dependent oxidoreductase [Sulfolobus sp. S-194]QIW23351.1 NAD(P)/FAD-dependent oxidoreductase [Sulfolobus sp. S-194]